MKLLRMPRLSQLLDVEKFKNIVNDYYQKELEQNIKNNKDDPYPIMTVVNLVHSY